MISISRDIKRPQRTLIGDDYLEVMPIGAGSEVGRSCIILRFKGKQVMFDCGIHPAMKGIDSLPYFDSITPEKIDLVLISHFHLDHVGAVPHFVEHTQFQGKVFMTNPTKAIVNLLLHDYVRIASDNSEKLYTAKDLESLESKIEGMDYREEKRYNGIKFWCYNAGHVLGAAMFMVEIAGIRVLYTGDFSSQPDRHLMGAEIPQVTPHVLMVESTYGTHVHESREERELRFKKMVKDVVQRGGKCLIPVFALGRAQELLLILEEFWEQTPSFHRIPIYYASSLAEKCMKIYHFYVNTMNDHIRSQIENYGHNPFDFQHIRKLRRASDLKDLPGACVVLASPGMLQSGLSRNLFEMWCQEAKNGLIVTGYCVEGTPARDVQSEPPRIVLSTGEEVPFRMTVRTISFSAHSDCEQTTGFIRQVNPGHVVLVHGSGKNVKKLRTALLQTFMFDRYIPIFTPRNTDRVRIEFKRERVGKILGKLAKEREGGRERVEGVFLNKDYQTHLIDAGELEHFFGMKVTGVHQKMIVSVEGKIEKEEEEEEDSYEWEKIDPWIDLKKQKDELVEYWKRRIGVQCGGLKVAVLSKIGSNLMFKVEKNSSVILVVNEKVRNMIQFSWHSTRSADMVVDFMAYCMMGKGDISYMVMRDMEKKQIEVENNYERVVLGKMKSVMSQVFVKVDLKEDLIVVNELATVNKEGQIRFIRNDEKKKKKKGETMMKDDNEEEEEEEEEEGKGENEEEEEKGFFLKKNEEDEKCKSLRKRLQVIVKRVLLCTDPMYSITSLKMRKQEQQ